MKVREVRKRTHISNEYMESDAKVGHMKDLFLPVGRSGEKGISHCSLT